LKYKNRTAKVARKGPRRQKIRKLGALDKSWLLGDKETVWQTPENLTKAREW
jgi:hypothetical protein